MMVKNKNDEMVQNNEFKQKRSSKRFELLCQRQPWTKRWDTAPFLYFLYPILCSMLIIYILNFTSSNMTPFIILCSGLTILLHLLLHLSTHWSKTWRVRICFDPVNHLEQATHVKVTPSKPGRNVALCPIFRETSNVSDSSIPPVVTIDFLKKRYRYNYSLKSFTPLAFPVDLPVSEYLSPSRINGLSSLDVASQYQHYGLNTFDINLPTFMELYKQHAVAPFFVFQIFCVTLWLLDEYWAHSLMTLVLLISLEAQLVFKRLKELQELKEMRVKPMPIYVYRDKKWLSIQSDQLLPGDVFSVHRRSESQGGGFVCPCDALLLQGSVVMNESVLTGESIPQTKVPLVVDENNISLPLDCKSTHRQHILFAGTTVVMHHPQSNETHGKSTTFSSTNDCKIYKKVPNQGCVCYVLRTGFETTQGKIVRTILYSAERITGESYEALLFLFILLLCSFMASGYVLYHNWTSTETEGRSRYKLLLNCIMIVTSVVPPEFPITMSMAVTLSLVELFKKKIFCTEPFRLPFAGRTTLCAFDKTGTLTSDKMEVRAVLGLPDTEELQIKLLESNHAIPVPESEVNDEGLTYTESSAEKESHKGIQMSTGGGWKKSEKKKAHNVNKTSSNRSKQSERKEDRQQTISKAIQALPMSTIAVMASCHSLALVESTIVGDPTEKAAVEAVGWNVKTMDMIVSSASGEPDVVTIIRRFPFASELQRMTVLVQHNGPAKSGMLHTNRANDAVSIKAQYENDTIFTEKTGTYVLSKGSPEMMLNFLKSPPSNYKELYEKINMSGYRVLCLAARRLGKISFLMNFVRRSEFFHLDRSHLESELEFAGFLVIGCPIKPYTTKSIASLKESNHKLVMITGDHPLTACQVASEIGMINKNISQPATAQFLLLKGIEKNGENNNNTNICYWTSRDGVETIITSIDKKELKKLSESRALCLSGHILEKYQNHTTFWSSIIPCISVFARMAPQQKESIISSLASNGEVIVMCGDGTNDVGALKAAHVGVSLLSGEVPDNKIKSITRKDAQSSFNASTYRSKETMKEKLARIIAEEEAGMQQPQLGTASIASPFTHKGESIRCVPTIIRLGRATLATVMTMYKTMAINSLITAFALSALTLDGVKLGDLQTTVENLFVSYLVFVTSRAQPAKHLSSKRPVESIFHPAVMCSIFGQSALHLWSLYSGWKKASEFRPLDYNPDIDGTFSSNLVNTVVFYIIAGTHGSAFLSNYEGEPFMISLRGNKLLWKGLVVFFVGLCLLVLEIAPGVNEYLSLVELPDLNMKYFVIRLLLLDIIGSWMIGRFCSRWGIRSKSVAIPSD